MPRTVDPSQIPTGSGAVPHGSVSSSTSSETLAAHLADPAAHPASSISIQDVFERYMAGHVEGALGELAALIPPFPGGVGSVGPPWLLGINVGVPDWGVLKLTDGALDLSSVNDPSEIYPYYWRAPISPLGNGLDPVVDPIFNAEDGLNDYTGGGPGKAHVTFATVSMGGAGPDGYPSLRTLPQLPASVAYGDVGVVVSGIVSPADRGVLALVHWDAGDTSAPAPAASAAEVLDRCPAALLLGRGLLGGGGGCDGTAGGIFTEGSPGPYDFPGRASGQPNLDEIHATIPEAGQVRLLTDPAASSFPPVAGGIPIFGATSIATGGGTDGNFFAYRLPYLKDYSNSTGIPYTPIAERPRFFLTIPPSSTGSVSKAGNYDNFPSDFWAIQLGRYRHRFPIGVGVPGALRRGGTYALVHFRREQYFEEYVRDGVVPTADKIYSVNLISWNGAQIGNILITSSQTPYYVNVSEIVEDPTGVTPTLASGTFVFTTKGGATSTTVSGVAYYVPRDPALGAANPNSYNLGITQIDNVQIDDVFTSTYRSHDREPLGGPLFGDDRALVLNQNPVFLSLSSFAYEGSEDPVSSTISLGGAGVESELFPAELGEVRRQRIEFGFADLHAGGTDPDPSDPAVINTSALTIPTGIRFEGDQDNPVFTENAKVRIFVRRPLVTDPITGYPFPADPLTGLTLDSSSPGNPKILYHSMKEITPDVLRPTYGNAANAANAIQNSTKDMEERFLDEVYRYPVTWEPFATTTPADAAKLIGPGLPAMGTVMVPVRPINGDPDFPGYYFNGYHLISIDGADPLVDREAQVAGLPERNAPFTDGVKSPFPSRGILLYPKDDYTSGYVPAGPDYSVATNSRHFVRAFDAHLSRAGETTLIFRFWGIEMANFAYAAPGPGSTDMAIMVKLPGLTTWMDVGRADGAGPSKQDPLIDGAGCLLLGSNTFEDVDPETQIHFTQVEVNFGPAAAIFLNAVEGTCPVLVKVILKDTAGARALDWQNVLPTGSTSLCRGLVGIEVPKP